MVRDIKSCYFRVHSRPAEFGPEPKVGIHMLCQICLLCSIPAQKYVLVPQVYNDRPVTETVKGKNLEANARNKGQG